MKRYSIIMLFALVGCHTSLAQYSRQYDECISKAGAQMAMNVCANEEALRVDAELNDTYRRLLAGLGNQSLPIEKIKLMERAWIVYRDAYIGAMFPATDKQSAYGSTFPTEVNLLRAKLTRQQTEALMGLLKQYGRSTH